MRRWEREDGDSEQDIGMLNTGIVDFVNDNACPHTAARTLNNFGGTFQSRSVQFHLTPSDYHLFLNLTKWVGSQRFGDGRKLVLHVSGGFKYTGHKKLVPR